MWRGLTSVVGEEVDPDLLLMNWTYCGCSATGGHGLCERAEPSLSLLSASVSSVTQLRSILTFWNN